jgi:hypothetical protein
MKTMRIPSLAAFLVAVSGLTVAATEPSTPGTPGDPVYVDSTDIRYLESFPVQVHLVVRGSLPTPCHEAAWDVQAGADGIDVTLWSTTEPGAICVDVLEPVEVSIPLGSFEAADLPVSLNGEPVGRVTVGDPAPTTDGSSLAGAGWSFGMCAGFCVADLVVGGHRVVLSGTDHRPQGHLFENEGALTPAGRDRFDAALADLGDATLEPTYGCPDCADGGAAYLTITRDGVTTRHDMEFGHPPGALADLYALSMSVIDSLQRCEPSDLVATAGSCVPYER